jgi:tRNA dimethylallyltransferase
MKRRALLIAGPTASGKSATALKIARLFDATIINADSMQVYRDLRVLTARPSREEEALAPHFLFGVVDGAVNHSVGLWLGEAKAAAERAFAETRPVVFVGGTGLYFRALTEGLSDIPAVPETIRAATRAEAEGCATPDLHARLGALDPETAARLRPSDRQRVLRALEVFAATGRPLAVFQGARGAPLLEAGEWAGLFLAPERDTLNAAIDARFDAMIAGGALEEVAALAARKLDSALPVMRAHGVPHLLAHLAGELTLDEVAARGKLDTRQYAKRQFTWARHQMKGFEWAAPSDAAEAGERALKALRMA